MIDAEFKIKRAIAIEGLKGMVPFLQDRSVGIVIIRNNKLVSSGSGTCVAIGDRYFIATAGHVLGQYNSKDIWISHTVEPSDMQIEIESLKTRGGITTEDYADVGWIELSQDNARLTRKEFIPLRQLEMNVSETDEFIIISGYPGALLDHEELKNGVASLQPICYATSSMPKSEWPAGRSDAENTFLYYPDKGNALLDSARYSLPDAPGVSGGGVWNLHLNPANLWAPSCARLIGVVRSWSETHRWVRATQSQHWLSVVREDIPELAGLIDPLLDQAADQGKA